MKDNKSATLEPRKGAVIAAIIAALVGLLVFCVLIKKDTEKTELITIDSFNENNEVEAVIESATHSVYIDIKGYAYIQNEPIQTVDNSIILHHIETDEYIKLPTMMIQRPDLNESKKDGYDYTYSGFYARIHRDLADLYNGTYEICLHYGNNGNNYFVRTGEMLGGNHG